MEYFIGAGIAILVVLVSNKYIKGYSANESSSEIKYSQSHIYELIRPFLSQIPAKSVGVTQSTNFVKKVYLKIMVVKDKAYWIKDNVFYVAEVVDGEVNRENARAVDTMAMDRVELDEMLFIIEKLREDDNDSRNSGK